jgi:hypothetical protein
MIVIKKTRDVRVISRDLHKRIIRDVKFQNQVSASFYTIGIHDMQGWDTKKWLFVLTDFTIPQPFQEDTITNILYI